MSATMNQMLLALINADDRRKAAALKILRGEIEVDSHKNPAPLLLKASPAARLLGVSKSTFWRLVQQGRLQPVPITGKANFFRRRDIEALAARVPQPASHEEGRSNPNQKES